MLSKLLAFISSAESVSVGMLSSLNVLHFQRSSSIWSFVSFVSPNAPWQRGKVSFSSVKLTTDRNNAGSNQRNLVTHSALPLLKHQNGNVWTRQTSCGQNKTCFIVSWPLKPNRRLFHYIVWTLGEAEKYHGLTMDRPLAMPCKPASSSEL